MILIRLKKNNAYIVSDNYFKLNQNLIRDLHLYSRTEYTKNRRKK